MHVAAHACLLQMPCLHRNGLFMTVQDTICRDPFYKVMPAYFGMTLKELIAVKHPTAWLEFEKGETAQEDLFRDFFKDGRSFDHNAFLDTVVSLICC